MLPSGPLQEEIYEQLRALAAHKMRGQSPGHTLQATALVNEAFVKILGGKQTTVRDRRHFFAVAALAMHQVLVNHARARGAAKRGGDWRRVTLNEALTPGGGQEFDVFVLNQLLAELEALDERQARIVKLRFFSGMELAEIAEVLEVSLSTVKRDWRMARAWLSAAYARGEGR